MINYPLIKFVSLFICGYLVQALLNIKNEILFCISICLLILLLALSWFKNGFIFLFKNITLALAVVSVSCLYYSFFHKPKVSYPFRESKYKDVRIIGNVNGIELSREYKIVFYLSTDSIFINKKPIKININLMCNLYGPKRNLYDVYNSLKIGDKIVACGSLLRARNKRNIGEFDFENYLNERQIHGLVNINNINELKIISRRTYFIPNFIHNVRKKIDNIIITYHNKNTSALLKSLLLGDRSKIEYETKTDFINTGVIHILAVSGLHVGFISLIFILLFQRFNIYLKYIFTILGLLCFMLITNSPPSVVRATIMAIVMILSFLLGRKYLSMNSLALSAFIILLVNPNELFNSGFQLSFAAVTSILFFYPRFLRRILAFGIKSKLLKNILLFCAVSLAAQIGVIPLTLIYFSKLSLIALFANILVIPLVGFIVGLGMFTLLISFISTSICIYFANVNELLAYILFLITNKLSHISFAYIPVHQFSIYDAIIFYFVLLFMYYSLRKLDSIFIKILIIILLIFNLYFWIKVDNINLMPRNKLTIIAIDVGQGDAFLIKFPNEKVALIDAGYANKYFDNGEKVIMPVLEKLGIDKIDYGFISHIDLDHTGGFYSLIKNKKIKFIYKPMLDSNDSFDVNFEKYLRRYNIPFNYYSRQILNVDNVRIFILNDTNYYKNIFFESNDRSGLIKIVFGKTSFLFTGDISSKIEKYYSIKYKSFLKSDLLKVSHHGSKYGTSELFLNYVQPVYALISVGIFNQFRHPHQEVMYRLLKRNIKVFRTDLNGAVIFQSDGYSIRSVDWKKHDNKIIF